MSMVGIMCATLACLFVIGFGIGLHYVGSAEAQSTTIVNIPGQGTVLGSLGQTLWTNESYWQFLGIPYAESTKGEGRFKAAVPRAPWTHVHDGTKFGLRCPVITTVEKMSEQERQAQDLEDCLNLCVYTKSLTATQPVMFYIYGGGFYNGSASDHPPRHLLADHKDIVLVVAQYRVGALGWLSTYTNEMPGNAPMSDLLLALKWVQNNIRKFGGDPSRVTMVGQSAGSVISGALLLSPNTANQQLFRSVILQSASVLADWARTRDPITQARRICKAVNCQNCENFELLHACLVKTDVLELLKVTTTNDENFYPVVGDLLNFLPTEPKTLLAQFDRSIPVMTGFTKHDGSFVLATYYDTMNSVDKGTFSKMTVREVAEGLVNQFAIDSGMIYNVLVRLLFDRTPNLLDTKNHTAALPAYFDILNIGGIKSDTISLAKSLMKKGFDKVFLYSFDYEGANTRFGYEFGNEQYPFEGGVHHSNDNIYIFSTHNLNEADTKMAKKMVTLWTSFIINGIPKGLTDDPIIMPMTTDIGPYFHINTKISVENDVLKELTVTVDDPENYKLIRPDVQF